MLGRMSTSYRAHVLAERVTNCPAPAGLQYATDFFRGLEGAKRVPEVHLPLGALGIPFPKSLSRPVRFQFSLHENLTQNEKRDEYEEIAFTWKAMTRWLPDFQGTLQARAAPHATTTLHIEGSYVPPFGALGQAFDRAIGHTLAEKTMQNLLDTIARHLEAEQHAFEGAH